MKASSWLKPLDELNRGLRRGRLSNGVPWFLLPIDGPQTVSFQLWFRRGARHDPRGRAGCAHFLEHMLFRGSRNHRDGAFDIEAEQRGIEANAMTWFDYTAYIHECAPAAITAALELERDRWREPLLLAETVEEEREIILNERSTHVDADPDARIDEFVARSLPDAFPYKRPVLGTDQSIAAIARHDLIGFHRAMLLRDEVFLVAAGAIDPAEIVDSFEGAFGDAPLGEAIRECPSAEPNGTSPRATFQLPPLLHYEDADLAEPRVNLNLFVPGFAHDDAPRATILAELLAGGPYGILEEIFEDGPFACVDSSLDAHLHAETSLATLSLIPPETLRPATLAAEAHDALTVRLRALEPRELREAAQRIAIRALRNIDYPAAIAEALAAAALYRESDDDPFALLRRSMEVSRDEVVEFAERWLAPENRSVTIAAAS